MLGTSPADAGGGGRRTCLMMKLHQLEEKLQNTIHLNLKAKMQPNKGSSVYRNRNSTKRDTELDEHILEQFNSS